MIKHCLATLVYVVGKYLAIQFKLFFYNCYTFYFDYLFQLGLLVYLIAHVIGQCM